MIVGQSADVWRTRVENPAPLMERYDQAVFDELVDLWQLVGRHEQCKY